MPDRSGLQKQCLDAADALAAVGSFESGQGILRDAAAEIARLEHIAYNVEARHVDDCDCIQCVPF